MNNNEADFNIGSFFNKVQDIAQKVKEESEKLTLTTSVGGGMIEMKVNGNNEVIDLKIDDSLLSDKDSLQILLISAINDILKQADEARKEAAMKALGNFNMFENN